ncbi:ATR checkpoint kinase Rad3 [Schizosaccharomyces osmophilus]|uniref:non-specific serine/threonine protein kinase n=1 Tax=Schizosaccharomyces osmophilus TaxID=2545709 RepID=A0AAE9WA54_9SCHI|nr:ATR checkpoint kinase Rad3 [Schizosaccharomyces osmophilus]WBW72420.1 ATR checkpoint kinase Rad3 [Schizosaccharomyces osmophilus]
MSQFIQRRSESLNLTPKYSDDRHVFEQLLIEITLFDQDAASQNNSRSIPVTFQIIQILVEAGLFVLESDDYKNILIPSNLLKEAKQSIQCLLLILKKCPEVLCEETPCGVLLTWLLPRTIFVFKNFQLADLFDDICELHHTLFHFLFVKDYLWPFQSVYLRAWKYYIDTISSSLLETTNLSFPLRMLPLDPRPLSLVGGKFDGKEETNFPIIIDNYQEACSFYLESVHVFAKYLAPINKLNDVSLYFLNGYWIKPKYLNFLFLLKKLVITDISCLTHTRCRAIQCLIFFFLKSAIVQNSPCQKTKDLLLMFAKSYLFSFPHVSSFVDYTYALYFLSLCILPDSYSESSRSFSLHLLSSQTLMTICNDEHSDSHTSVLLFKYLLENKKDNIYKIIYEKNKVLGTENTDKCGFYRSSTLNQLFSFAFFLAYPFSAKTNLEVPPVKLCPLKSFSEWLLSSGSSSIDDVNCMLSDVLSSLASISDHELQEFELSLCKQHSSNELLSFQGCLACDSNVVQYREKNAKLLNIPSDQIFLKLLDSDLIKCSETKLYFALRALNRWLNHTNPRYLLVSHQMKEKLIPLLCSTTRSVRILAASVVPKVFFNSSIQKDVDLLRNIRMEVLRTLKDISSSDVSLMETTIITWENVGRLAEGEELHLVLLQIISIAIEFDIYYQGICLHALQSIARSRRVSVWKLLSPYWPTISVTIIRGMTSKPNIVGLFAEAMDISESDFLIRTQSYTLPYLVLTKNHHVISRIAELSQTDVAALCLTNMHKILAVLLTTDYPNLEESVMLLLSLASSDFRKIDLSSLLRSDPIALTVELLQLYNSGVPREKIENALKKVALMVSQSSSELSDSDEDKLLHDFFNNHILGILAEFSNILNDLKGKTSVNDKIRTIVGIREMFTLSGNAIKLGLPQILSSLQNAFQDDTLRSYAIDTWLQLVSYINEPEYTSIASLSLVLFPIIYKKLRGQEAETVQKVFDFIASDPHNCLSELRWAIPTTLDLPCFKDNTRDIFSKLQNDDFFVNIEDIIKCLRNEHESVCYLGLQKLDIFLENKQEELHEVLYSDASDSILDQLLRCLLDCCIKFAHSNDEIAKLCTRNIAKLGAVDPSRLEARSNIQQTVVLDNFEDGEESLRFILDFIQSQLIPAFLVTTDTKAQGFIAYALQEFLKLGGFKSAVLNNKKSTSLTVVAEHWKALPDLSKRVLIPFLNSKYHLTLVPKLDINFPIFKQNMDTHSWVQEISLKLTEFPHSQNADRIFSICSKVIKDQEMSIPCFLLPFLVLNVVITEKDEVVELVIAEFQYIINQPSPDGLDSIGKQRYASFVNLFFNIVDYLNNWLRMRKKRNWSRRSALARRENRYMSVDDLTTQENSVSKVESFLLRFPSKTLGLVSLNCGFHARALFYWEQHIRTALLEKPGSLLDSDYRILQDVYTGIEDPDGIEAVSLNFHDYSLDQQLLLHENSGKWDSALSCYEILVQNYPENHRAKVGLLNAMLQSGHYESLVLSVDSLMETDSEASTSSKIIDLGIEAAWHSLSVNSLQKCIQKSNLQTFDAKLGEIFQNYLLQESDLATMEYQLEPLYAEAASIISNIGAHSSYDCYEMLSKLHALYDFSKIAEIDLTPNSQEKLEVFLHRRLNKVAPYGRYRHHILSTHLVAFSRFKLREKLAGIYLEIARFSRKNGQAQRAYNAILKAMELDKPQATIEHARWWWHQGQQRKAIAELHSSLENNIFDGESFNIKNKKASQTGNPLKGKVYLELTKWLGKAGQLGLKDLETHYSKSVEIYAEWEKNHYYLGHHRVLMFEEEKKLPVYEQSERFLSGELVTRIINEFGRSLYYGTSHIYESMPKLLTLWLDFGAEELRLSKDDGEKYFREHINLSRKKSLELMNSNICRLAVKIPQYFFLIALSQMISRICHPNNKVYKILEHLVANVIATYPSETLWQLMATIKSISQKRSVRGKSILNVLQSKKVAITSKIDLRVLSQSAILLTEKLVDLCNTRIDSKAVKMSLKNHFKMVFDTPVELVIPARSFLNISLPATDANRITHHPFPKNQPEILKFEDEVDIMNSLQKPRKVYVRGTDGNVYPFLCKPKDDLRKDARLMEFNNVICKILRKDQEANRRNLCIRTYVVIPLNEECGFIEWVNHTRPFRDILLKNYRQKNIPISYQEIKVDLDMALRSPNPGESFEKTMLPKFPPVFYEWFVESFPEPNSWVNSRRNYSRTLAVMSIVGYVLGLGDRHGENILFDEFTGEAIHVDFNCLFDKGLTFEKPEKVPFRLTHNMVDAMGPTGYEGGFRKASEITMKLLRSNQDTLMSVLESFLHDPLVEWNRRKITGRYPGNEANEVLDTIRKKFQGYMPGETIPLSVEGQIQELIRSAVSPKNLVEMYIGWAAYF